MAAFTQEGLPEVAIGTQVGDFQVRAKVAGDPGLYDAVDSSGRRVALVLVEREVSEARGFARRFRRLARARARLNHRNLLKVWDWGESEHGLYLVMQRSRAPTLAEKLRLRGGPLEAATSVRLLAGVAEGLGAAHAVGLVPRALAPADIRVEARGGGRPLLGDLGITKPHHTGLSSLVGDSVYYASPEELRDEPLVPQSNVYSLACILCECLTGEPPYPVQLRVAVPYTHLTEAPPSLTRRRPELPPEIDSVMASAMAAEVSDRYDSPRTLMQAAGAALRADVAIPSARRRTPQRPGPASAGATPSRPRPPMRLIPWLALALAVGVLALAVGVGGYRIGAHETAPAHDTGRPAAVATAVEGLRAKRLALRRRLDAAKRPATQAAAARDLARAYADARAALESAASPALLRAVSRSRRAYAELAAAAQGRDRPAYNAASVSVREAEREVDRALSLSASRARP